MKALCSCRRAVKFMVNLTGVYKLNFTFTFIAFRLVMTHMYVYPCCRTYWSVSICFEIIVLSNHLRILLGPLPSSASKQWRSVMNYNTRPPPSCIGRILLIVCCRNSVWPSLTTRCMTGKRQLHRVQLWPLRRLCLSSSHPVRWISDHSQMSYRRVVVT